MINKNNKFFGSKLNTVLLFILIILMIVALRFMFKNKETYLPMLSKTKNENVKPVIEGNKDDLVSFSVDAGGEVSGKMKVDGSVKGGYFFEGNILVNILDGSKDKVPYELGHANATSDWMTSGPVSFTANLDFTNLPKGKAYIEIHNDNASGLPQNDKSILIPIIIK